MSNREDYKDNRRVRHNTPRRLDKVYIDGRWMEEVVDVGSVTTMPTVKRTWIKSRFSRVNGMVVYVDRDVEEATVSFTDHPYADVDEPKTMRLPFSVFYGRWDENRDLFILTDECVS